MSQLCQSFVTALSQLCQNSVTALSSCRHLPAKLIWVKILCDHGERYVIGDIGTNPQTVPRGAHWVDLEVSDHANALI